MLGIHWKPAVLETELELNFVKQAQRGMSDVGNYWIGGRTSVRDPDFIEYSQYIPHLGDPSCWNSYSTVCTFPNDALTHSTFLFLPPANEVAGR